MNTFKFNVDFSAANQNLEEANFTITTNESKEEVATYFTDICFEDHLTRKQLECFEDYPNLVCVTVE